MMINTIDQLKWRYATKRFDSSKMLSEEKLDIIKQSFNLTATSYGLQTLKLVIVKDKILRDSLLEHAYNQKQVTEASHLLVICIDNDILETEVVNYYNNIKSIRNTPDAILAPYRKNLIDMIGRMSVKERQQWSTNQAYIAIGNLMTVCALEQIDACPMEGFSPKAFDEILNLKSKGLKSVLLLPVGYRADDDTFSTLEKVRKPLNDVIIEL